MHSFSDLGQLSEVLSQQIAAQLGAAIEQQGEALLAVSGGSTPRLLFEKLSKIELAWHKVRVVLVDERWLDTQSVHSNEHLVRSTLLQNAAQSAHLQGLKSAAASAKQAQAACNLALQALPANIDVLLLGMGDDGHTASWFPCGDQKILGQMLDKNNARRAMALQPNSAPHERMSLTLSYLLTSRHRYLLLKGDNKLTSLRRAVAGADTMAMPIRAFLGQANPRLEVFYATQ
jgi:6-phosphogluconolactonase